MNIYAKIGDNRLYNNPPKSVIQQEGLVKVDTEPPTKNHIAQEDGTWALSESKVEEAYEADIATLDSMQLHVLRHERNGETEKASRAELKFKIAQAEIMEKYGKGSTVYITENGECYHTDSECTGLANSSNVVEIKLSDGLKNYSQCSLCCE